MIENFTHSVKSSLRFHEKLLFASFYRFCGKVVVRKYNKSIFLFFCLLYRWLFSVDYLIK